ncbi:MAG: ElyC/SanA/YdcF family protein [Cytophagales bacterium]|nr:ElyC/SanA/YdcF family protein [Cytophagales bacterium]
MKKLAKLLLLAIAAAVAFVIICNVIILMGSRDQIATLSDLQESNYKVALVLGTSKWTMQGTQNLYFKGRVEASQKLIRTKHVAHLLLSGDNSLKEYNEPLLLKKELEAQGVPASAMTMDFAGFRTLDSIIRAKEVFGQDSLVIVTQSFHLPRALYIARHHKIQAIGFTAPGPQPAKMRLREVIARTVAVLDILFGTQPKFLGKEEPLPVD